MFKFPWPTYSHPMPTPDEFRAGDLVVRFDAARLARDWPGLMYLNIAGRPLLVCCGVVVEQLARARGQADAIAEVARQVRERDAVAIAKITTKALATEIALIGALS